MMIHQSILVGCALMGVLSIAASPMQPANPEVALAPFAVIDDKAGDLRPLADECLEQLAKALSAKGVTVARQSSLDEKTLARAKPARWAVLGRFEREKNSIRAELRLMEVSTGDEMRSYFNSSSDPKEIVALGPRAADRIVVFVREKR
jgi:TolB-like protein